MAVITKAQLQEMYDKAAQEIHELKLEVDKKGSVIEVVAEKAREEKERLERRAKDLQQRLDDWDNTFEDRVKEEAERLRTMDGNAWGIEILKAVFWVSIGCAATLLLTAGA